MYFVWLRITDEGPVPEIRIWSILLIKSDLKWCIHLSSLYLYLKRKHDDISGDDREREGGESQESVDTDGSKTEVPRGVRNSKRPETRQVQERLVSTLEHMQVPTSDRTRCPEE